jgi:hypothetical protein
MQAVISTIVETGVMSTYTIDSAGLWQREVHLYGSSRLCIHQVGVNLSNPVHVSIKTVFTISGKARTFIRGNKPAYQQAGSLKLQ